MRYAALVLALVGCTHDYSLHGDVTFTAEERSAIEAANGFVAEHVATEPLEIVWDEPHSATDDADHLTIMRSPEGTGGALSKRSHVHLGTGNTAGIIGHFEAVAAHELGHFYGLGHTKGGAPGMMAPVIVDMDGPVWTEADEVICYRSPRGVCRGRPLE